MSRNTIFNEGPVTEMNDGNKFNINFNMTFFYFFWDFFKWIFNFILSMLGGKIYIIILAIGILLILSYFVYDCIY
jgi:hypothetical protein